MTFCLNAYISHYVCGMKTWGGRGWGGGALGEDQEEDGGRVRIIKAAAQLQLLHNLDLRRH